MKQTRKEEEKKKKTDMNILTTSHTSLIQPPASALLPRQNSSEPGSEGRIFFFFVGLDFLSASSSLSAQPVPIRKTWKKKRLAAFPQREKKKKNQQVVVIVGVRGLVVPPRWEGGEEQEKATSLFFSSLLSLSFSFSERSPKRPVTCTRRKESVSSATHWTEASALKEEIHHSLSQGSFSFSPALFLSVGHRLEQKIGRDGETDGFAIRSLPS